MSTFNGKASEIENNSNKIDVIKHSDTDKSAKYPSEQAIIDFLGGAEYQDDYIVVGDSVTGGVKSSGVKVEYLNTAYTQSLMLKDGSDKIEDGNIVIGSPGTLPLPHYVKDSGINLSKLQSDINQKATVGNPLQPYVIPMGSPAGDGSLWGDTGVHIHDIALNKPLELLNEITLTEGATVIFNTDSDGRALALTKFELLVSLPAVTSATLIWVGINGNCVAYTQASSASAKNPTYRIWGEYIPGKNDWDFQSAMNNTSGDGVGTIFAFPNGNRYSGTLPSSAGGVIIATNAALTNALPAGTKVTLWGVRE